MPGPRPKDVLAFTSAVSGMPIFRTSTRPANECRLEWSGNSPQEFVEIATKSGARLLYLRTSEEDHQQENEPALVELSFQCDGLFHCFCAIAPWADAEEVLAADSEEKTTPVDMFDDVDDPDEDDDGPNDSELAAQLTADEDAVAAGFAEHFLKSDEFSLNDYFVKNALEEYLSEIRGGPDEAWNLPKYTKAIERIAKRVTKELGDREKKQIDPLVGECVAWARSSGLKTLNQSDAQVFLRQSNQRLSHEGMRLLWQEVKFQLKARR